MAGEMSAILKKEKFNFCVKVSLQLNFCSSFTSPPSLFFLHYPVSCMHIIFALFQKNIFKLMTFESVKFQKQQSEPRYWTGLAAAEMQCIFYFTITFISNEPMLNRHCLFYCFHFPQDLIMYMNYFLQSTISMNPLGRQSAAG